MSAMGQSEKSGHATAKSASPSRMDIVRSGPLVRFVPEAVMRSHRPHSAGGLFGQPRFPKTLNKQL
jgi:hypothetical protein